MSSRVKIRVMTVGIHRLYYGLGVSFFCAFNGCRHCIYIGEKFKSVSKVANSTTTKTKLYCFKHAEVDSRPR